MPIAIFDSDLNQASDIMNRHAILREDIAFAIAAERERCAKIAEEFPAQFLYIYERPGSPPGNAMVPSTGKHIADAIRQSVEADAAQAEKLVLRALRDRGL
jgi:hypothetical protein